MQVFKKSGKEPQRKQLEQGSKDAQVHKAVSERLPDPAVQKDAGDQAEPVAEWNDQVWQRQLAEEQCKKCKQVDQHQAARGSAEVRE